MTQTWPNLSLSRSFRATRAVLCCVLIPTSETDGLSAASCHGESCVLIHACRVFMQTFRSTYHGYWDILATIRVSLPTVTEVKDTRSGGVKSSRRSCWEFRLYPLTIPEGRNLFDLNTWTACFVPLASLGRKQETCGDDEEIWRAGHSCEWKSSSFACTTRIPLFSQHIKSSCSIIAENGEPYQRDSQQRPAFEILFPFRCQGRKLFSPKELSPEHRRRPINKTWQEKPQHQIFFRKNKRKEMRFDTHPWPWQ